MSLAPPRPACCAGLATDATKPLGIRHAARSPLPGKTWRPGSTRPHRLLGGRQTPTAPLLSAPTQAARLPAPQPCWRQHSPGAPETAAPAQSHCARCRWPPAAAGCRPGRRQSLSPDGCAGSQRRGQPARALATESPRLGERPGGRAQRPPSGARAAARAAAPILPWTPSQPTPLEKVAFPPCFWYIVIDRLHSFCVGFKDVQIETFRSRRYGPLTAAMGYQDGARTGFF